MDMKMTLTEMVKNRGRVQVRGVPYIASSIIAGHHRGGVGIRMNERADIWRAFFPHRTMEWIVDYELDTQGTAHAQCFAMIGDKLQMVSEVIIDYPNSKFECHSDMINAIWAISRSHGLGAVVADIDRNAPQFKILEEFDDEVRTAWLAFQKVKEQ